MKLIVVVFTLFIIGCTGQKKAAMEDDSNVSQEVNQIEILMDDQFGVFEADELMVIKDEKRLKAFFSKINQTRKPGLPVPEVDFTKNMLVIQCVSKKAHDNFKVLSVFDETETQLVLKSKATKKTSSKISDAGYSSFRIYKMPNSEKEITVEEGIR